MSIEAVLANEQQWHVEVSHVEDGLRKLPDGCIQSVITSPPYWSLRSYLPSGHPDKELELGSEPTPDAFVSRMVDVFREVRRVLRNDGSLWVNLADTYDAGTRTERTPCQQEKQHGYWNNENIRQRVTSDESKTGELLNMPHRVASALSADGWFWRSTIIWSKKSPMPESISGWRWQRCRIKSEAARRPRQHGHHDGRNLSVPIDSQPQTKWNHCPGCDKCRANDGYILRRGKWRPTTAHEYIFLFTKSERYFCDGDAVKEPTTGNAHSRGNGLNPKARSIDAANHKDRPKQNDSFSAACNEVVETRNPRSVWTFGNEPEKAKHFATFPSAIPRKCLKAAVSPAGCCPKCGASYAPVVESERIPTRPALNNKIWKHSEHDDPLQGQRSDSSPNLDPFRHIAVTHVTGYRPTCDCQAGNPIPSIVCDIFSGSGTTGRVAYSLGLRYIGFELSEEYAAISREKIVRPFAKQKTPKAKRPMSDQKPLFE